MKFINYITSIIWIASMALCAYHGSFGMWLIFILLGSVGAMILIENGFADKILSKI